MEKLNIFVIKYLDNITKYIENARYEHIQDIYSILDVLTRDELFANLKKYFFHKNQVCFFIYIVVDQRINI